MPHVLHQNSQNALVFRCPGCKDSHIIPISGDGPVWKWNGDMEKPTFSPSVLVTSGHYIQNGKDTCWCDFNMKHPESPAPFECVRCHSFVTNGRIEFLSDCSHALSGKTVDMEEWE